MAQKTGPVIEYYTYQKAWLADLARFKIGMFARQTGKTFTTCGEIVDDCVQAEIAGKRTRWVILSRGERQAKEAMDEAIIPMVKAFWAIYRTLLKGDAPKVEESEFRVTREDGTDAVYKQLDVIFPNGSKISALPANPDTARGYSANVLLDEFAFHKDSRKIWTALFPVISKNGLKLRVVSTPNGKGNKFYELMTGKDDEWSRHSVDIHQAVAMGCPRNVDQLKAGMADDDAWSQEYELNWLDEASAWLSYDLIATCEDPRAGLPRLYQGGLCTVGVDIAARNDLFVIWVNEITNWGLVTREVIARRRISFAEQDRLLDDVVARYRVLKIAMDQTGMGEKPVEDAKARYGEGRVDGVLFTAQRKLALAQGLKEGFEDRSFLIPGGDPVLRADLHSIKSNVGPTGIRRLIADGESDGHADRFWACALAKAAASQGGYQEFDYRPVKRPGHLTIRWSGTSPSTGGLRRARGVW
ncbi:MAG: terminase [Hyphomonadaceae bacterium]|nr:terminase [Hyphomonadaceae bacterium]